MDLPGGLWRAGAVRRDFGFRPPTGALELAVSEAAAAPAGTAARVSAVLSAALDTLGGEPASGAAVGALCVADRQFLMHRLGEHLGVEAQWLTARCLRCGAPFDFSVRYSALPVKERGPSFPFAELGGDAPGLRARVPTGADQEAIAGIGDRAAARAALAERCLAAASDPAAERPPLTPALLDLVDAALERTSPDVATRVEGACPACGEVQPLDADPYFCLHLPGTGILGEVHTIAAAYHWSERDILGLSRERRRQYLALIEGPGATAS